MRSLALHSYCDQILCILWDSVPERLLLCVPEGTGLSYPPNSSVPFVKLAFGETLIQRLHNLVFLLMGVKKLGILCLLIVRKDILGNLVESARSPGTHFRQGTICQLYPNPIWKWFGVCIGVILIAFVLEKALFKTEFFASNGCRTGIWRSAIIPGIASSDFSKMANNFVCHAECV
jgi:hypothetical protein